MPRRRAARWAGVAAASLIALQPAVAAVREVAELPNAATLQNRASSLAGAKGEQQRVLLSMYVNGDDEGILRRLSELAARDRALADDLREELAGAYLRDRRLYRATQQLDAIAAARRSDQARFMAANIAGRQRRLDDASRLLDDLALRLPRDPFVARDQAQVASLLGDPQRTASACERLLRIAPRDEFAQFLLARTRMQQGRLADADRLLTSLVARNAGHSPAALNLGLLRLAEGDAEGAVARFVQARSIEGRDAAPYVAEATAWLLLGSRAPARAAVAGAVKQNPGDPLTGLLDLLVSGGSQPRLVGAGSPRAAAGIFPDLERVPLPATLVSEIAAPGAAGRIAVASVLHAQWSPQAALAWLSRTAGTGQGPLAESTTIRALAGSGNTGEARSRAARLAASPQGRDLVGASMQQAEAAAREGDRSGAIAAMQEAVTRAPRLAAVHASFGDLYNAFGRRPDAVDEYRAALRQSPGDPRLTNRLAAALVLSGRGEGVQEGLALAEAGLKQRPDYATRAMLLGTRADALYELHRPREALAAYRELSSTVGGIASPEPWHRLGTLALQARDRATARRAFEEALDYGRDYPGRGQAIVELERLAVGPARN